MLEIYLQFVVLCSLLCQGQSQNSKATVSCRFLVLVECTKLESYRLKFQVVAVHHILKRCSFSVQHHLLIIIQS